MLNQPLFAALDVSLETTTMCIMAQDGTVIREAVVATPPRWRLLGACIARFDGLGSRRALFRSGWSADSPFSASRRSDGNAPGPRCVVGHVLKTDRKDARGMAHLLRTGWFRPVHVKSVGAREQRAMLAARATLVARLKDIENSVRGLLRGFGLRLHGPCGAAGMPVCAR